MPLMLVDALEPADAASLRAHLATGCTRCAAYLSEADATLAYLPFALDPVAPAASARDRLMQRLGTHVSEIQKSQAPRRLPLMPTWARRVLPPALAACLTIIATAKYMMNVQ